MQEQVKNISLPLWLDNAIDAIGEEDLGCAIKGLFSDYSENVECPETMTDGAFVLLQCLRGITQGDAN